MIERIGKREVVTTVLLSIVTCGIYGIVWFIGLTDDASKASGDRSMSGGTAFLLTLVTCGLYSIYWNYKMGKLVYEAQTKRNMKATDNSVLYLVLGLFGLGLVNYILIQSALNEISDFDYNGQQA
ncbi:MAG: DUF4234 domain-containing protein [Bacilli bacterium]|nr:DUF4234 domain-containing protein [Bacilli bacterium]